MAKKKRKNKAAHARTPHPSERRHVVSYDDIGQAPVPPVPRHKVSYASDVDSDEEEKEEEEEEAPEQRHEVVSQTALRERDRPYTDVTYGQAGAFPGLDPRDNRPFYGPANDGLDYLRMVRSEARQIPHIVSAPTTSQQDDGYGEDAYDEDYDEGWYSDGAYVAPSVTSPMPEPQPTTLHPQEAFYAYLATRFQNLRTLLRQPPSIHALKSLPTSIPISFPTHPRHVSLAATKDWKHHINHTAPLSAQLASMDTQAVLSVLKLCEGQLENCRSRNIPRNLGLWCWGLLARLDDVGLLGTREVSVVREVAKMGVWIRGMHVRALEGRVAEFGEWAGGGGGEDEDYEDEEYGDGEEHGYQRPEQEEHDGGDEKEVDTGLQDADIASRIADKKRELLEAENVKEETEAEVVEEEEVYDMEMDGEEEEEEQEQEEFPDANTAVTIDMLITVAAEFYGQKDLLVGRLPWDGSTG